VILVFERVLDVILSPLLLAWLLIIISLGAQLRNNRRVAILTAVAAAAILWLAGNTVIGYFLAHTLEMQNVPSEELPHADAIVVLGGVTGKAYPPQPVPHLGAGADRLVYAALLYKQNKAPLVIFSGNDDESAEMTQVMEMMGIPTSAMLGENARLQNTYGGARDLKPILISHDVHQVLLVTSAIRMPRALAVFRSLGIDAIPAPTDFTTRKMPLALNFIGAIIPFGGCGYWSAAIHEIVGLVGYRLAGWIEPTRPTTPSKSLDDPRR
jgi:uncharacterized SAM-binding protein YcdF (DUF218 family)